MDSKAPEPVQSLLESLIAEGREVGLQVAAWLEGELVIDAWAGLADAATGRRVDGDTLFTGFSVSKGIVSTCVHILADRGLLDYEAPIARYWPEFAAKNKGRATVRDGLTHRLGIPQDPSGFRMEMAEDWEAICAAIADMEPLWEPGSRTSYHPLTFGWVLGEVVRRVDGRAIGRFLQEEICQPLGLSGLYFGVPSEQEHHVATLKDAETDPLLDLSLTPSLLSLAADFNRPEARRAAVPGAGALVNARSVAGLYAALAAGGALDGVRIVSEQRAAMLATPEPDIIVPGAEQIIWWKGHSLGYTLGGQGPRENRPDSFGYEGVGSIGFADPGRRYSFAFLRNLVDLSEHEFDSCIAVSRAVEQALGIA
jgi:CubicO group peptidase (beta-lactamase class C family)